MIDTDIEVVDSLGDSFYNLATMINYSKDNLESYVIGVSSHWESNAYQAFKRRTISHAQDLSDIAEGLRRMADELKETARLMRIAEDE